MKLILIIILLFFSKIISANESENDEVEVIILHESKSLDQMVLDNLNNENNINEVVENASVVDANEEVSTNEVAVEQIEIVKDNFIYKKQIKDLNNYFDNLQNINSKTLQKQIIEVLENLQLDLEIEQDKEILFLIVNYFKSIGQINKSFELIEKYELSNHKNFNFYNKVKLDYFLSTFQLNEACSFREELNSNIILEYSFLEKLDIFCSILNNNESEARLLNSILVESENYLDNYFQMLFSLITNPADQLLFNNEIKNSEINKELIFLYSAMTRIAELPFSHEFYELDKKNLSIPIILNQSSPTDLRIKAANESFLENLIAADSLAALYMSADFNSDQFNNSNNTIDSFSNNKELSMAFLYQLVNIQIFPNDRLNALVQFWDFAKQNNLEEISYKLSNNMLGSIDATSENIIYGPKIASAYIFNNNFEKAITWIELYENAKEVDTKSIYTRLLLDLYSTNNLDSFINSLNLTLDNYIEDQNNENEELFLVLKDVMNFDTKANTNINLDKIFDERLMPSITLFNEIKNSIVNNNDDKFLIYSLISLNNKNWNEIHPEHLKLILKGYLAYNDGLLFRNLILEVFKNYKFII
tara:strand:- start:520 stop:2289 length:1770 start_codon:yes stop_codon:yes gene_type:complete